MKAKHQNPISSSQQKNGDRDQLLVLLLGSPLKKKCMKKGTLLLWGLLSPLLIDAQAGNFKRDQEFLFWYSFIHIIMYSWNPNDPSKMDGLPSILWVNSFKPSLLSGFQHIYLAIYPSIYLLGGCFGWNPKVFCWTCRPNVGSPRLPGRHAGGSCWEARWHSRPGWVSSKFTYHT